jgi:hypothetical protein
MCSSARRSGQFAFKPGPVFAQVLLADEINRAGPKTQSALLEAMEERQVTIEGQSHALPQPFFVIATQNPSEQLGTYPLPESQLDRFLMTIRLGYPDRAAERELLTGRDKPRTAGRTAGRDESGAAAGRAAQRARAVHGQRGAVRLPAGPAGRDAQRPVVRRGPEPRAPGWPGCVPRAPRPCWPDAAMSRRRTCRRWPCRCWRTACTPRSGSGRGCRRAGARARRIRCPCPDERPPAALARPGGKRARHPPLRRPAPDAAQPLHRARPRVGAAFRAHAGAAAGGLDQRPAQPRLRADLPAGAAAGWPRCTPPTAIWPACAWRCSRPSPAMLDQDLLLRVRLHNTGARALRPVGLRLSDSRSASAGLRRRAGPEPCRTACWPGVRRSAATWSCRCCASKPRFPLGLFVAWSYWRPASTAMGLPGRGRSAAPPLPGRPQRRPRRRRPWRPRCQLGDATTSSTSVRAWRDGDSLRERAVEAAQPAPRPRERGALGARTRPARRPVASAGWTPPTPRDWTPRKRAGSAWPPGYWRPTRSSRDWGLRGVG